MRYIYFHHETTVHERSAVCLSPLDWLSIGPLLPRELCSVFPPSTVKGWVVMENWQKKKHFHMVTGL